MAETAELELKRQSLELSLEIRGKAWRANMVFDRTHKNVIFKTGALKAVLKQLFSDQAGEVWLISFFILSVAIETFSPVRIYFRWSGSQFLAALTFL